MATSFWKTVKTVENLSENPCLKGYSIDGDKFLENCSFWKTVKTVENLSENPCLKGYSIDGDKFLENCENSIKSVGKSLPKRI
jgi:hypothetical protein